MAEEGSNENEIIPPILLINLQRQAVSEGSNVSLDSLLSEVDDEMDDLSLSKSENKETQMMM